MDNFDARKLIKKGVRAIYRDGVEFLFWGDESIYSTYDSELRNRSGDTDMDILELQDERGWTIWIR